MRASGAALFPVGLLGLLAALTFWLEQATQEQPGRDGRSRHDPDFIVERFHVRRFDTEGMLQHSLVAQKMLHYPDDDSTEVLAPRLTYHRTPPTVVTSDTAWLSADGKQVRLDGDVRVVREALGSRPATTIATSVLHIVPDDETARTDAPVTITQGRSIIDGTGLEADNKTQTAVLLGRIRGIIDRGSSAVPANTTHERIQNEIKTPAVSPAVKPAKPAKPAAGVRGKGGQGKARQPRSRQNHRR
ncbi:hypothetical protein RHDC4_02993 [Rhodocyclaceae bacterium]|nr:hypothetical protein RHDC4_02993 [Rhodocyclaceae bacterium]